MFGTSQKDLGPALERIALMHCAYGDINRCDCKYGFDDRVRGERTGCPEASMAARLVDAMTPREFARLCKRARIHVFEHDPPVPVPRKRLAPEKCQLPPAGWSCKRNAGHRGPCAALPWDPHATAAGPPSSR